jgi:hypothetical protein
LLQTSFLILLMIKHRFDVNRGLHTWLNLGLGNGEGNLFVPRLLLEKLISCLVSHRAHCRGLMTYGNDRLVSVM